MKYFQSINNNDHCYVIAEAGLNHNGSIDIAKKLIEVAVSSGADAVKFQKRTIDNLAISKELKKPDTRFPEFGKTYGEIRNFLEFNKDQYLELYDYSKSKEIDFIVTAFDENSASLLQEIDISSIKLASHSLTNLKLIEFCSKLNKPIILSTGMCDLEDIDNAVEILKKSDSDFALLHCVSSYPTKYEDSNLNMIEYLSNRYKVTTGYSGHEIGYLPTIVAVSKGAKIIERHYTLDNKMIGFDHKISLEPSELKDMIRNIREVEKMHGSTNKSISQSELITLKKYHVSAVSKIQIEINQILDEKMIEYKNPGTGISPKNVYKIIGKKSKDRIQKDTILEENMFC